MSDSLFDMGAAIEGFPGAGDLMKKKADTTKSALFGGGSDSPAPNDPWTNAIQAFVAHKEKQKQADKVGWLSTLLSGDQTQPINPSSTQTKTVLGG